MMCSIFRTAPIQPPHLAAQALGELSRQDPPQLLGTERLLVGAWAAGFLLCASAAMLTCRMFRAAWRLLW